MFNLCIHADKQNWNIALQAFKSFDMYHTYDYHKISQNNGEGEPLLLLVTTENGEPVIFWPILKRNIPGTGLYDLTSVFGYSGPIFNEIAPLRQGFEFLFDSLSSLGFVSIFSRLHPLLVGGLHSHLSYIELDSHLVAIEITHNEDVLNAYRQNHRRDIKRAFRSGVRAVVDEDLEGIEEFMDIYHQAMRDLQADEYYFYDVNYITSLAEATDFRTHLIFAYLGDIKIAGALFITTRDIMQYYIGGVVSEFKSLSPLKIILKRAHELAIELQVRSFILGVGAGGGNDALFRFKMGFSGRAFPLSIFKRIINTKVYDELCASKGVDPGVISYFPAYRRPLVE